MHLDRAEKYLQSMESLFSMQGSQHQVMSFPLVLPLHPPHPQGARCHSLLTSCLFHGCPARHLQLQGRSGLWHSRPHWPTMTTSPPEHPLIPLCNGGYPISSESKPHCSGCGWGIGNNKIRGNHRRLWGTGNKAMVKRSNRKGGMWAMTRHD